MLKIVSHNIETYKKICQFPRLRKFFVFDLEKLQTVNDEEGFYQAMGTIQVTNKITKSTWQQRFQELNSACLSYFPKNQRHSIHDVAVSDGITSVELFEILLVT